MLLYVPESQFKYLRCRFWYSAKYHDRTATYRAYVVLLRQTNTLPPISKVNNSHLFETHQAKENVVYRC